MKDDYGKEMFIDKKDCCGCEACINACKFDAIKMQYDDYGFKYPIIDKAKCKNCKMCEKACPIKNKNEKKEKSDRINVEKIYAGYNTKMDELNKSASGGISFLLNNYFIKNNGVVFGVRYCEGYKDAEYVRIENEKDLQELRSSKYIQASKGNIYQIVKKDLENNKKVLFTGLPCEVAGLKTFLKKEFPNLYTCGLICSGPTSPKVQKQYIEYYEKKEKEKVKFFNVRSKKKGWGPPNHIEIVLESGKSILQPFNKTAFGRGFEILCRESCLNCKFKIDNTVADITIGDYWGVDKNSNIYNKNGVTIILFHNNKLLDIIKSIENFKITEVTYEEAIINNEMIEKSRKENIRRKKFVKNMNKKGLISAYKKNDSIYNKILNKVRLIKKS